MSKALKLAGKLDALESARGVVLTVGVFDGVHLGHRHLLRMVIERAEQVGAVSAVVTFEPHPQAVLSPGSEPPLLTTVEERVCLIREVGIDVVGVLRFTTKVSLMSAEQYVDVLLDYFPLIEVWLGPGSAFGRGRQGTPEVLSEIGRRKGFSVRVVSPKLDDSVIISSTEIRRLLFHGNVEESARLLGRAFSLSGEVVSGFERGRELGFPTANVATPPELLVPANGIYAVRVRVGGEQLHGVVNIGTRPTFEDGAGRTIEVHILDFGGNLYGQRICLEFIERLRDEITFPNVQGLVEQIRHDVDQARRVLQRL